MQESSIRDTTVEMKSQDYQQLQTIVQWLQQQQPLRLQYILAKSQQCFLLKQDGSFIKELFEKHQNLILEMIQWMFLPKKIITRKQLISNGNKNFAQPYLCCNFISRNTYFYEQMYVAAKQNILPMSLWLNFLINQSIDQTTIYTSLGYFQEIFIPFIQQDYHCQTNANVSGSLNICNEKQSNNTILSIFSDGIIKKLIELSHYPQIFKFLKSLVITSLEEENQMWKATQILQKLFLYIKSKNQVMLNICLFLEEIVVNITPGRLKKVNLLVQTFISTNIIDCAIKRIINSPLCKLEIDISVSDEEQEIVEYYLRFLSYILQIYNKLIKLEDKKDPKIGSMQQLYVSQEILDTKGIQQYNKIVSELHPQIEIILKNLPSLLLLVQSSCEKIIPFSSGQSIVAITLVKYEYFRVILKSLLIFKDKPQQHFIDMEKLDLFSLVKKYLNENRWNNIAHHVLEKITKILVLNYYSLFKKNNMEKTNMVDGFLGFLTENFMNRNYFFLNSLKTTTQGNLHSLYVIAKTVAFQLHSNHSLINVLESFEPWKNFIMKDLKNYEEIIANTNDFNLTYGTIDGQKQIQIDEIDAVDSIKKIVAKVQKAQKWAVKKKKKKVYSSAIFVGKDKNIHKYPQKSNSLSAFLSQTKKIFDRQASNNQQNDHQAIIQERQSEKIQSKNSLKSLKVHKKNSLNENHSLQEQQKNQFIQSLNILQLNTESQIKSGRVIKSQKISKKRKQNLSSQQENENSPLKKVDEKKKEQCDYSDKIQNPFSDQKTQ